MFIRSNDQLDDLVEKAQHIVQGRSPQQLRDNEALRTSVVTDRTEVQSTIDKIGFVPLNPIPYERDRDPLVVDWDKLDQERKTLHPCAK